ncbi:MAG: GNAT family N-acetyltransferase [Saccharofermentanales bacterium]
METIKKGSNRFFIGETPEDAVAEITFVPTGDGRITIDHTYVSEKLRGQGIALALLESVVQYARSENIRIIPACSYAKKVLINNEKYADVLADR